MKEVKIPWPGWKMVRPIGSGGFGHVYEIERDIFGKKEKAAMKIISVPSDPAQIEQDYSDGYSREEVIEKYSWVLEHMAKEYNLMSSMKGHSNIVSCEDFSLVQHEEEIGGDIYIRMELLTPLQTLQKNVPFTEEMVIKLGKDICKALVLCQSKHIIHRDIKPQNIMVSSFGDFKLGDFGVSRTMEQTTAATKAGTEYYMAPEVIKREKYGQRVDIYSLGLVLYCLLNRQRMPFLPINRKYSVQENHKAHSMRVAGETIPAPIDGSEALKKIVLKACAYRPEDRYADAQEMLEALSALPTPSKKPEGNPEKKSNTVKENAEKKSDALKEKAEKKRDTVKEKAENKKDASEEILLEKLRKKSTAMGVYFGDMYIWVSAYCEGKCCTILEIPAVIAVTEVGEMLSADRADRYIHCHNDSSIYSGFRMMNDNKWINKPGIYYKGSAFFAKEMLRLLVKEIRRQLDQKGFQKMIDTVIAVSSDSYFCREILYEIFSDAGFRVMQILTSAFACSIFNLYKVRGSAEVLAYSLERKTLQINLAKYSEGCLENIHTSQMILTGEKDPVGNNLIFAGKALMTQEIQKRDSEKEEMLEILNRAEICCYADFLSTQQFGELKDRIYPMEYVSAAGAAVMCAYIKVKKGTLSDRYVSDFIVLENLPMAYGLEVEGPDKRTLCEKRWLIEEQTEIPCKSRTYSVIPSASGYDTLKIHIGHTQKEGMHETIIMDLKNIYQKFKLRPNRVEIILWVDVRGKLYGEIENPVNGEKKVLNISPEYQVNSSGKQEKGNYSRKQALRATWEEMRRFHAEWQKLEKSEKESSIGKGLRALDKQCEIFLKKRNMQFNSQPYDLDQKKDGEIESLREQALTLLEILDGFEYGIRSFPDREGNNSPAETLIMRFYRKFIRHMEKVYSVRPIEAEGAYFDSNIHYAIDTEKRADAKEGQVLCERQRGYYMDRQVLRPSKVKVAE